MTRPASDYQLRVVSVTWDDPINGPVHAARNLLALNKTHPTDTAQTGDKAQPARKTG